MDRDNEEPLPQMWKALLSCPETVTQDGGVRTPPLSKTGRRSTHRAESHSRQPRNLSFITKSAGGLDQTVITDWGRGDDAMGTLGALSSQ